jgi:hypothetical protein
MATDGFMVVSPGERSPGAESSRCRMAAAAGARGVGWESAGSAGVRTAREAHDSMRPTAGDPGEDQLVDDGVVRVAHRDERTMGPAARLAVGGHPGGGERREAE